MIVHLRGRVKALEMRHQVVATALRRNLRAATPMMTMHQAVGQALRQRTTMTTGQAVTQDRHSLAMMGRAVRQFRETLADLVLAEGSIRWATCPLVVALTGCSSG